MKISQLVKQTGVSKETIHFYIRIGLLRKPRKSGINTADYNERYIEQILLIKNIRENYYLPIPKIKNFLKNYNKQSSAGQASSKYHSEFNRPLERLITNEVVGREAFHKATGLGRKWIKKAEHWGLLSPNVSDDGQVIYCSDDVAIGKLMVDMDQLGFGPKDGGDPEQLKIISDFIRKYIVNSFESFYQNNLDKLSTIDFDQKSSQFHEAISLFFYHLYRKTSREVIQLLQKSKN